VARTGLWSAGVQLLGAASQFLFVPLFLSTWGSELYGDWLSISALVSYLALADAGMQGFVLNRLSAKAAQDRWDEIRPELASALAMYAGLLGTSTALALVAAGLGPWARWYEGRPIAAQAPGIAAVLVLHAALSVLSGLVCGLYRVFGRQDLAQAATFCSRLLQLVGIGAALGLGAGPRGVAFAQVIVVLVLAVGCAFDVRRREPRLVFSFVGASLRVALGFMAPSLLFLLFALANGFALQGVVLVTSSIAGAVAVVTLATTRTVASVVRQFVSLLSLSAWNELTRMDAAGDTHRLERAHRMLVKMSGLVAATLGAWLLFAGPEMYAWWTAGRALADVALMRLLVIDQVLSTPAFVSMMLLAATNRHASVAWMQVAIGLLLVFSAWLLVRPFGLPAIGVSALVLNSGVQSVLLPRWTAEVTGEPARAQFLGSYLPLLGLFAALLAVAFAAWNVLPVGPVRITGSAASLGLVAPPLMYFFVLTPEERAVARALAQRLRRRVGLVESARTLASNESPR
jgi:O-antigen/teichoic acid export membrane protein